jgi:hypothetical protein
MSKNDVHMVVEAMVADDNRIHDEVVAIEDTSAPVH